MGSDGLLIVDKPGGITSLDVVRRAKRRLGVKKAGHVGTLDPFATGVLPVALGEGTKLIPFLSDEPKRYEGTLKLGEETTTDDLTGEVISRKPWSGVTSEEIEEATRLFVGKILQIPPMFSAVKMAGEPLYRLARKGLDVERKGREVHVFRFQIEEVSLPRVRFQVSCSKGTYVRALARDLGRQIGCGAHLIHLRRVQSGVFSIEAAVSWEDMNALEPENLRLAILPLEGALPGLPEMVGDRGLVRKVRLGQGMHVRDLSSQLPPEFDRGKWIKVIAPGEGLVAILKSEVNRSDIPWAKGDSLVLRPLRVFHPKP
jgi:tRNA pseudouridine55 synthase